MVIELLQPVPQFTSAATVGGNDVSAMVAAQIAVIAVSTRFTHEDACRVSRLAAKNRLASTIVVDLNPATDAETAAFAQLVLLRRKLLRTGRDLRLSGLRDRAKNLYEFHRLTEVLPRLSARRERTPAIPLA